jgi:hypothetical protein
MNHIIKNYALLFSISIGLLLTVGCTGGGETVISGLGNSGNYVGKDDEVAMLANALARQSVVPRVSDAEIIKLYTNVQEMALEGDFKASIVILRLAARQRDKEEDEAE